MFLGVLTVFLRDFEGIFGVFGWQDGDEIGFIYMGALEDDLKTFLSKR